MPLHPSFACISAQVRPLRHDTLNRAHQEALEAEIWYTEKNYKSLSPKPTNSKDPVKPNFSQPRSVFQHGSTIPKYPSINNSSTHYASSQQRFQAFCKNCKRPGHDEAQCYAKERNFLIDHTTTRPPNRVFSLQEKDNVTENVIEVQEQEETAETEFLQYPEGCSPLQQIYVEPIKQEDY